MIAPTSTFGGDAASASFSQQASAVAEINRLYAEARRLSEQSRESLSGALLAAWRAGKLLIEEKARVRRHAGRGAWIPWLESCFHGGVRTAQRYMQLARRIGDTTALHGLSLRQTYLRLGIPIAPQQGEHPRHSTLLKKLPTHAVLAAKLTRLLRAKAPAESPELIALYGQLRVLFESKKTA